jgi:serine/threonine-protein kinase SRPK3
MGETLRSFGAMFPESRIPYWIMRKFTTELLAALDYAHDHKVIHTGALTLTVLGVLKS